MRRLCGQRAGRRAARVSTLANRLPFRLQTAEESPPIQTHRTEGLFYTLCTINYTLYTIHYILYTIHYTLPPSFLAFLSRVLVYLITFMGLHSLPVSATSHNVLLKKGRTRLRPRSGARNIQNLLGKIRHTKRFLFFVESKNNF